MSLSTNLLAQVEKDRWAIADQERIVWKIENNDPHKDHIEMSGRRLSVVLRYGVDSEGGFILNRSIVWPMLRSKPNETHDHLNRRFDLDVRKSVLVDGRAIGPEKVDSVTLDGTMRVESRFPSSQLHLTRTLFPSMTLPAYCEKYVWKNNSGKPLRIDLPEIDLVDTTDSEKGIYGEYAIDVQSMKHGRFALEPDEEVVFYCIFSARKSPEPLVEIDPDAEWNARQKFAQSVFSNLVLKTPNPVLNTMFAFAKLRGTESIYETKGGLMHGPGGESYYAAIWANDQAEYINPFFPFLGNPDGNESAVNSFRHFARYMNDDFRPIPSSIISEGVGIWNGAGDRGDAAMIAYGASRYALACGDKDEANRLWPLIEWCLEFSRRKINDNGVVSSDSDELEGRFPAGKANLCTSCLYYDALVSAVYLGKELGKPERQLEEYESQSRTLNTAIEKHFGYHVEGFETYRYYDGNDVLRSWICIPLTVEIFDRSKGTVDALFSERLWTADGLLTQAGTNTFWDRSTLYGLRGVFAAGAKERGLEYLDRYSRRRLLGDHVPYAIEAWPEGEQRHLSAESGLYCRIFTEAIFGIRPTGLRSFKLQPQMPEKWDSMSLKSIRAFGSDFGIDIARASGNLHVTVTADGQKILEKTIEVGQKIEIRLDANDQ